MIRHHFTLTHICREITSKTGASVVGCFSQEACSLMLVLQIGREELFLEINTDPVFSTVVFRPGYMPARKNVRPFFRELTGQRLLNAEIDATDRILRLRFDVDLVLESRIFGGAKSDVVLIDRNGETIGSFSGKQAKSATKQLTYFREFPPETEIFRALAKSNLLLGEYYARETCRRAYISAYAPLGSLSESEKDILENCALQLCEECKESPLCYILQKNERSAILFSLIPLAEFPITIWRGVSAGEGVRKTIMLRRRERRGTELHARLERTLTKKLQKLKRAAEMAANDAVSDERAQSRREWAEILLAQPNVSERSGNSIMLNDWGGEQIIIPLDSRYTIAENAAIMFGKARDAAKRTELRRKRLPEFYRNIAEIESDLKKLETNPISEIFQIMEKKYVEDGTANTTQEQSKYRKFDLEDGFTVYVGKNATNNDELTMRFAKPNDYWFHARGVGGSHVVLRCSDSKSKPPKRIIEQTAAIALYYSQQRSGGYAPVAYAQKKYVRKPKGANPGAVIMEREEVIMAYPKLPFDMENTG